MARDHVLCHGFFDKTSGFAPENHNCPGSRDAGTFFLRLPGTGSAPSLDLNDRDSMEQAVREAKSRFGTIDVRVNNAGCGYLAAVEESNPKEVEALFQTNFFGPARLMQLVLPQMREKRSGMIVNVTSIGAVRGALGNGYYSAAKGALELLTEAMEKETEHLGIRAMLVEPGAFRTGFYGERLKGSSLRIADYDVLADRYRKDRMTNAGNQPGDPDRGGEIIVEKRERAGGFSGGISMSVQGARGEKVKNKVFNLRWLIFPGCVMIDAKHLHF